MNDPPSSARVQPAAPGPEEQGRTAVGGSPRGAAVREPAVERVDRRLPERDGALLAALAEHADGAPLEVDVIAIQPAQLADTDPGGIEQLEHSLVAQLLHRVGRVVARRCWGVECSRCLAA